MSKSYSKSSSTSNIKYIINLAIFNVCGVTLVTCHLQKIDHINLVKHGFLRPQDISLTENSKQLFLPGGATNSQNSPYISVWPLDQLMKVRCFLVYAAVTCLFMYSLFTASRC